MKTYIYVTGGKGGIGKSMQTLAMVDYLAEQGKKILLLDADPVNGDSSANYKNGKQDGVTCERVQLRSEDASGQIDASGLQDTLNKTESTKANTVIVDAPAGDSTLLVEAGSIIVAGCSMLGAQSVIVWMVDSVDRTAINALAAAWESIKDANMILLVKNHRKGNNFDCFDGSKAVAGILAAPNVKVIDMPKIASRLEHHFRIDRKTLKEVATEAPMGDRVEAVRVRKLFSDTLKGVGL